MTDHSADSDGQQMETAPGEAQIASEQPVSRNLLRRFISRIPYTHDFRSRIKEREENFYKTRVDKYQELESIDEGLKKKLFFELKYGARAISKIDSYIELIEFYVSGLAAIIIALLYVIAPMLMTRFFPHLGGWQLQGIWWWTLELLLTTLIGVIVFVLILFPVHIVLGANKRVDEFFNSIGIVLFLALILLPSAGTYLYGLNSGRLVSSPLLTQRLFFYFVIQCGSLVPLLLVLGIFVRLVANALKSRRDALYTRAVIVDELLNLLSTIEKSTYRTAWTELSHRTWLTKRLEAVAYCIENYFPRYFVTGVREMDGWTDRCTSEMANGVRDLIKKVIAPNTHTFSDFKVRILEYFVAAVKSDWGAFERVPAEKLSRRQGLRDRARSTATVIFTAGVPILLLILLKRLNVVAEPLLTYLTVGAYIWVALSLLSRLDPQYAAKLGALKDLTNMLPGRKGGGES